MRTIAVFGCLIIATAATASLALDVTVLPRPGFPAPVADVRASGPRLLLVSSRYHPPALAPPAPPAPPKWAPTLFRGHDLQLAIRQPGGVIFFIYGEPGHGVYPGRIVVAANAWTQGLRYAFDLINVGRAPNGGWFEYLQWAREANGVLYVENTHPTYASATRGRNAYISAIDLNSRKLLWRSPALVANARTFVLVGDLIVSGYGFTAEPDFLYLLERRTGKVLDRLPVPSAPEIVKLRGNRLHVRTYDRQVVARIAGS